MAKKCEMCHKRDAKRVSYIYVLPNSHVSRWQRFKRKHFPNMSAIKRFLCDDCYFECNHGLYTLHCDGCNKLTKVSIEDFCNTKQIFCAFCGEEWKET